MYFSRKIINWPLVIYCSLFTVQQKLIFQLAYPKGLISLEALAERVFNFFYLLGSFKKGDERI